MMQQHNLGLLRLALICASAVGVLQSSSCLGAQPANSAEKISPADLVVPTSISFAEQVKRHATILDRLAKIAAQAVANKDAARAAKNFDDYVSAEEDLDNVKKALVPYAVGQEKAAALIAQGYKLGDLAGKVCKAGDCVVTDPIAAVFFLRDKNGKAGKLAVAPRTKPSKPDPDPDPDCPAGEHCNICVNGVNVCTVYDILADKPLDTLTFGILPAVRDAIIPPNDNGEIAKFIRDPGKTTLQGIQNLRDHWIGHDNGEGAKILRDPIKCTVGRLWHACK